MGIVFAQLRAVVIGEDPTSLEEDETVKINVNVSSLAILHGIDLAGAQRGPCLRGASDNSFLLRSKLRTQNCIRCQLLSKQCHSLLIFYRHCK